jgi:hypothetical protein
MPRYFFHVYHERPQLDDVGEELPNKHGAWEEATKTAGKILQDWTVGLSPNMIGGWRS